MTKAPTILFCVGATKAGTSWLYDYLAHHPGCHMRSIKELHYFDTLETGAFRQQLAVHRRFAARLRQRLLTATGDGLRRATDKMQDVLEWQEVLQEKAENAPRYLSYLTQGRSDEALVADITPSYALLPVARLRAMAALSPDTRFIYLMRDPIARLWSHVRMLGRRAGVAGEAFAKSCSDTLEQVLNGAQSSMTERGDYAGALARLNAAIAPGKLLVMFMEEMLTPNGLARLCAFLGIDCQPANFDQPVHVGPALAMTLDQTQRARALLHPQYDYIARHYPDIPENWRRNMGEAAK
ncbi:sulfotransferase [Pseudorhodobacter sp.]|uniref:sulfotransferase family protein n=1 Tax=Pseudorhodobacter sp. TaxID=1934400 RepID=UPI0026482CFE|nr:sulfotransferase [Pseudorhodobacter sp.]MDN5787744.1 sulfotransferase [Pseudorhodobacter sp.]